MKPHFVRVIAIMAAVTALTASCGASTSAPVTAPTPRATATAAAATPAPSPASAHSVLAAPVHIAVTSAGRVAYRSVGSGPILLLIMGFGGTMDSWTPQFITALARSHRVLTFDNAGVGRTTPLADPLTITAMARQTAALLDTLRTGPVDVLGWSMGGMIAQALAVTNPGLVRRLVLAATLPGNGTATAPSAAVQKKLADAATNPASLLPLLFPANASAASDAYVAATLSWPDSHFPSPATVEAQGLALTSWVGGAEPAGQRIGSIAKPTLIADGTADALVPAPNVAALVSAIRGSRKVIYPDAGHAFLFQDQTQFLARVATFLG